MSVVADIGRTLGGGARAVMREHLARGPQDARSFMFLMVGSLLVAAAQLPSLSRDAAAAQLGLPMETMLARGIPAELRTMDVFVGYTMFCWLVVWPLLAACIAGLTWAVSRALGGRGAGWTARLAMFWAWLAAAPLGLLTGLLAGLTGASPATNLAGAAWLVLFFWLWSRCQAEASRGA